MYFLYCVKKDKIEIIMSLFFANFLRISANYKLLKVKFFY